MCACDSVRGRYARRAVAGARRRGWRVGLFFRSRYYNQRKGIGFSGNGAAHSSKTGRNIIIGQTHAEICKSRRTEHDPRPRGRGRGEVLHALPMRDQCKIGERKREREKELKSGRWSFPRLCSTIHICTCVLRVARIEDPKLFSRRVDEFRVDNVSNPLGEVLIQSLSARLLLAIDGCY